MRLIVLLAAFFFAAFATPSGWAQQSGTRLVLEMDRAVADSAGQTADVLRKRIDGAGITQAVVELLGQGRIEVRVAGNVDRTSLVNLLTTSGIMTFHMTDANAAIPDYQLGVLRNGRLALLDGKRTLVIYVDPIVSGADVADVSATKDVAGNPAVEIKFEPEGAKRVGKATSESVGKPIAVVIDNSIVMAPLIMTPINGGVLQILSDFDAKEAEQLAVVLRSGALPARLKVVEIGTVGPKAQ